jgi:hypothetical protein
MNILRHFHPAGRPISSVNPFISTGNRSEEIQDSLVPEEIT